jgi:hypothetical protein
MKGKMILPSNETITILIPLLMPTRTSNQIRHNSNKQKPFTIPINIKKKIKNSQSRTITKPNNVALSFAIEIEIKIGRARITKLLSPALDYDPNNEHILVSRVCNCTEKEENRKMKKMRD